MILSAGDIPDILTLCCDVRVRIVNFSHQTTKCTEMLNCLVSKFINLSGALLLRILICLSVCLLVPVIHMSLFFTCKNVNTLLVLWPLYLGEGGFLISTV